MTSFVNRYRKTIIDLVYLDSVEYTHLITQYFFHLKIDLDFTINLIHLRTGEDFIKLNII